MTPRDRIADAIEAAGGKVKRSGLQWPATCPAHEDRTPSLSLGVGFDGCALIRCHALCQPEDIVAALGLTMSDLFPESTRRDVEEPATPPTTYPYHDADGVVVFEVVREVGKRFWQRRPDGNGGWVKNMDNVTRVLYRLPELLEHDGDAWIVEGEKDADRLRDEGLPTTCNPGGAGKWRDEYVAALAGRDVVVIPDNDDVGRAHAQQVAASLHGVATSVRVVELDGLPVGGDVSTWLDQGGGRVELQLLAYTTPEWVDGGDLDEGGARRVILVRGSDIRAEHVEHLDEGLIPLRTVTLVTGLDGVGKSTILYEKAARLTRGTLKGHYFGIPSDVVIASSEDHPASVIIPRLVAAGADLDRIHVVRVRFVEGLDGDVSLPDDLDAIARRVAEVNARMLIVDPLVAHMPLNVDSHKAQHVRSVMAPLAHLAEEAHLAVCAVVHFNGSPSTDVRTRISGSKALRDASRSVLVCGPDPADDDRMVMIQDKNSFGPRSATGWGYRIEPAAVQIDGVTYDTSRVRWLGDVAITSRGLLGGALDPDERGERDLARDAILDALAGGEHDWAALGRLIRAEGVSEITGRRARDELRREGLIAKRKRGAAGWVWNLLTPPEDDPDPDRVSKFDNAHSRNGFEATDPPENEELAHPLDGEQVEQVRGSTAAADAPDPNPNRGRYGTVLMVEEEEALVRFRQGKAELDDAADLLREILGAEEVEE